MNRWIDPQPVNIPDRLRDVVGGHPLVLRTLVRRGISTPENARAFLDPAHYAPAEPTDLPGLAPAVERVQQAIRRGERMAVWGDFDADGQTATAVLLQMLRALGADATFRVPTRDEGHGLHKAGLAALITEGAQLILTCDTGVTAHAAVDHAKAMGADVIITDHHVPGPHLPRALAVINPHRLPDGHPLGTLPGVGVAYQLAKALEPSLADLALDLVAIGTVADVATLTGDTRYLVQRGLQALRQTGRRGLQEIVQAADLRPSGITEEHISFLLGPRLNALGRLADAAHGVELLITEDTTRARILAAEVEGLNAQRKWLTKQVTDAALAQIEREPGLLKEYHALVLNHHTWPDGVTGIVAGRLAERFGKPAVLISEPRGQMARGSGRSVPAVDLIAALTECAPLLQGFGGHRAAAGFRIWPERIPELRVTLSRAISAHTEAIPEPARSIDAYVELSDLTLDLVAEINRLAPFGPGNPPLTLVVRDVRVVSETTIGRTAEHRRLTVEDAQERTQTVFWWQGADQPVPQGRFDLAITVRASDYRGAAQVQVEWLATRELEPTPATLRRAPSIRVRDCRAEQDSEATLTALAAEEGVQIWAEGDGPAGLETRTRVQLAPSPRLAIWSLPPGPRELRAALELVQPEEVILFAHDPKLDEPGAFLRRLAGLVKHSLERKSGTMQLQDAAAATAQRVSAVQAGLEWLAAQGQIAIVDKGEDVWLLARRKGGSNRQTEARARLEALLAETAAFRAYVRSTPDTGLLVN